MYGEGRRGIHKHTTVCGNTPSRSAEQSEYDGFAHTGSDSLPASTGVDKSYCSVFNFSIPDCGRQVSYIHEINFCFSKVYYIPSSSRQSDSPAGGSLPPGLSTFTSAPHSSRFSPSGYNPWTKPPQLSATETLPAHYPLFIIWATKRRFRSMSIFRASRSPFFARSR